MVDLSIKNGDGPYLCNSLPEGTSTLKHPDYLMDYKEVKASPFKAYCDGTLLTTEGPRDAMGQAC